MERNDPIDAANRKAQELESSLPHAMTARYDRRVERVFIRLSTGAEVAFSPRDAQGLENALPAQLDAIEISPSGFGIHFPAVDADVYLPALLEGILGSRNWMAARTGATGGDSQSAANAAAKRNGRSRSRSRKRAAAA
ncbi:MAG: DUF2442 domain-containing protein [Terracidiphilus sp.]